MKMKLYYVVKDNTKVMGHEPDLVYIYPVLMAPTDRQLSNDNPTVMNMLLNKRLK